MRRNHLDVILERLAMVEDVQHRFLLAEDLRKRAVRAARESGATYDQIGKRLGCTVQGAYALANNGRITRAKKRGAAA